MTESIKAHKDQSRCLKREACFKCSIKLQKQMATNSPSSAGLLLRLVGLGGGTGGCLAWGGTGGGASESAEEGAAGEGRGGSSTISETVLGGLATGTAAEEEEEEEEEDDEEEDGVGLLVESVEGAVRDAGGSRACLGGGGSCWESFAGRGSGAKRTPVDSTEGEHTCKHLRRGDNKNGNTKGHHHIQ